MAMIRVGSGFALVFCCQLTATYAAMVGPSSDISQPDTNPAYANVSDQDSTSLWTGTQQRVAASLAVDPDEAMATSAPVSTDRVIDVLASSTSTRAMAGADATLIVTPEGINVRRMIPALNVEPADDAVGETPNLNWSQPLETETESRPIVPAAVPLPPALGVGLMTFGLSLYASRRMRRARN